MNDTKLVCSDASTRYIGSVLVAVQSPSNLTNKARGVNMLYRQGGHWWDSFGDSHPASSGIYGNSGD